MKKTFIIFLVIFAVILSSCGLEDEYSEDSDMSRPSLNQFSEDEDFSTDFVEQTALDKIDDYDFDGEVFVIATTDGKYLIPGENETFLDKAISERTSAIEKKFNIDIQVKVESSENLLANVRSSANNNEHYADLVVAPGNVLSELLSKEEEEGKLLNLNSLPYVDYSADYVDKSLIEASQINGKLYLLYGSFTQTQYSAWCVFYNEDLSRKIGIDPYKLYKSGEWTWDAFLDYSKRVSAYTESGFVTTAAESDFVNTLWAMSGNRFFGDCSASPLDLPQVEGADDIVSWIKNVISNETYGKVSGKAATEAFMNGKSGMLLCRRDAVYQICESGLDWCAVPLPKYNSEAEHFAYIDGEAMAVAVPSNVSDTEFTGRILNALLAYTEETVSAGIDKNELYYYWTDNQTALAMKETLKYGYLDIAIIYAHAVKDISAVTTDHLAESVKTGIPMFQFYHSTKNQFKIYAAKAFG